MHRILQFVERRAAEQDQTPFILWLDDDSVPARDRLAGWLPVAAAFAFGFKDLNAMILRYPEDEVGGDPLKRAINKHTKEDANHWPMYLNDLAKLGLDEQMKFSEVLRFMWGKDTLSQRRANYALCQMAERADSPILRYCIVATIEVFGHYLFEKLFHVSEEFEQESGIELQYLGPLHFSREPGHMANQDDDAEALARDHELDDVTYERALAMVAEVCDLVEERWAEFHRYATDKVSAAS